jgi:hypothetical protein
MELQKSTGNAMNDQDPARCLYDARDMRPAFVVKGDTTYELDAGRVGAARYTIDPIRRVACLGRRCLPW